MEQYRVARNRLVSVLSRKNRSQEHCTSDDLEQLHRSGDTRKLYELVNQERRSSDPAIEICRDRDGRLLASSGEVVKRWMLHFEEHLNGDIMNRRMNAEVPLAAPGHDDD